LWRSSAISGAGSARGEADRERQEDRLVEQAQDRDAVRIRSIGDSA
jgi:hypothetical protein